MEGTARRYTLGQIASRVSGELRGDPNLPLEGVSEPDKAEGTDLVLAGSRKVLDAAEASKAAAILIDASLGEAQKPHILVKDFRNAFREVLSLYTRSTVGINGVHPTAVISDSSRVDPSASIGPYCVVEEGCEVGQNARLLAHCYVGPGCAVGARTTLMPHATLVQDVRVGEDCILHSGCVIGSDGFGFARTSRGVEKVPQIGRVVIEDFVEIGANTCIDRATLGETVIRSQSKVDNLVQIAHNVTIQPEGLIASQTGIAGSTVIGARATFGGQVGIGDHVTIADNVMLAGQAGVQSDIKDPGAYYGTPSMPYAQGMRVVALIRRLPELLSRLRRLEARIEEADRDAKDS
ncbi:MAG: UDP-3-O-(3-hydroxymyristoyl)glucosamine N-acyltransferase [Fimbriimonadaceae bacterium]|nr:UDP-3-O-(3-hydroxymyristoyl)glucosamine N-acyltransferase [Fimbriimonadaceae bacterium]QYK56347.1 MAG: UDP-3-O-(3-hydroxymyristoyl)glucosamine N-acyltransferase [Fimbriimonadaceae bacterium]